MDLIERLESAGFNMSNSKIQFGVKSPVIMYEI